MKFDDIEFEMRDGDGSPGLLLKKDTESCYLDSNCQQD